MNDLPFAVFLVGVHKIFEPKLKIEFFLFFKKLNTEFDGSSDHNDTHAIIVSN